jgi:major membrane immunogen (membrane-anchored lipoprotein)
MKIGMVCLAVLLWAVCLPAGSFAEGKLRDGVWSAETKPDYEGYFCRVTLTVNKGRITGCDWEIRDANRKNRLFDETYGPEVFKNQKLYQKQSEENLQGMKAYIDQLLATQSLEKVDAVTGATWARGKFEEALIAVLKEAKK